MFDPQRGGAVDRYRTVADSPLLREDTAVALLDTKWLPLAFGGSILGMVLALPDKILASHNDQPIFLLGVLFSIDGMMAFRVMGYATIGGPEERRERLERLFYAFPRSRNRYALAIAIFLIAIAAVNLVPMGDWYLFVMVGAVCLYGLILMIELFRCRSAAG